MNVLVVAARYSQVAALCAVWLGAPSRADAEELALLGLFEDHVLAQPTDLTLRRRALIAAQRLSLQCRYYYQVRGGGTGVESTDCGDGERALARIGPESAAAILDVLDEPRVQGDQRGGPFPALVRALAHTGRVELVPILLRAAERLEQREGLEDPRVQGFASSYGSNLLEALGTLTYVTGHDLFALGTSRDFNATPDRAAYLDWYETHKNESRTEWRRQAIARALELLHNDNAEVASWARCRLATFPETKAQAIARLKAHVRQPECADWQCSDERSVLQSLEPRVKWLPPEWTP
jgi:hypothetical protein